MSKLPDVFLEGQQKNNWKVFNGEAGLPENLTCDVVIVGTGAGGGITAEVLTRAGLDVILLEEGPLKTSTDFKQKESDAFKSLYQEAGTRSNLDKSISIVQGRCVGGTTVINWTSSFRTPTDTLKYWQDHFNLKDFTDTNLSNWFDQAEQRLGIAPWDLAPNANNELLRTGGSKLGIATHVIPRNVKACWNIGSCGMGCPTNAKQSMLITTIPTALTAGARLFYQTRAEKFDIKNGSVSALECSSIKPNGDLVSRKKMRITAKHYVVSGGAINSPALLKRSNVPDPHQLLGTRTFLHPTSMMSAVYPQPIEGWTGAPQSIYSDHYLQTQPIDGPIGFKIETAPVHPGMAAIVMGGIGHDLAQRFDNFPNTQLMASLTRDGFHPESIGGTVDTSYDGSPLLKYELTPFILDGVRRSYLAMAEIQFAAGAQQVLPFHIKGRYYKNWAEAKSAIAQLDMSPISTRVGSAHVMGGCRFAGSESLGVLRPDGVHWQVGNLSVHDGSIFPTSIGANPQLSIYGITNKLATQLAKRLTGKDVKLVG